MRKAFEKEVVFNMYYFGYDNTIITLQAFIGVKSVNVFRVHPVSFFRKQF
jgi:hypothetical protein